MYILGISAFYHDAAAALIQDGKIIAAAQEERFTRKKHDDSFPINAIRFCLHQAHIDVNELEAVVFYEKPFLKFERLLETYLAFAPKGIRSFLKAIPLWTRKKLFVKKIIREELGAFNRGKKLSCKILFSQHHLSHAASAYYSSPFNEAAVLTIDAVGESATTSVFHAKNNQLTCIKEMHFPHSIGLLYSAFTYYLGFRVNSGEYKLMGLAPYGNRDSEQTIHFRNIIADKLCTVYEDGSVFLHQQYFNYAAGLTMANDDRCKELFGFARRNESEAITGSHANLALAIQLFTEEVVIKLAKEAKRVTGYNNICLAGGVALNCVANSKLTAEKIFSQIYVQPAAGDAGGAIGAALAAYHIYYNNEKEVNVYDAMQGTYLGPSYSTEAIEDTLKEHKAVYHVLHGQELFDKTAALIEAGNVAGWFQGNMEFGPRALGNRSILADPRNPEMQKRMNLKIKFRESFRPFAPAVKQEKAADYFLVDGPSPYMLFVHQVKDFSPGSLPADFSVLGIDGKLASVKNSLPAITHVDGTARLQTVGRQTNSVFWNLLDAFEKSTGCPVLINSSFNVRGEPIVCTPKDALRCFLKTGMDVLVMGNFLLLKEEQRNTRVPDYEEKPGID